VFKSKVVEDVSFSSVEDVSFSSVEDVSFLSETAESCAACRCCGVLVRNVVWDCNVKAVEVPDRRKSRANLDKFVILEWSSGSVLILPVIVDKI